MRKHGLLILCCIMSMACNGISGGRSELNNRILKLREKGNRIPDDSALQDELAELLLSAGDFESAMRITNALIAENADPEPELLIRSAELQYLTGDYEAAEQQLLAAKEISRNSGLLMTVDFYLSFVYYQTDRYSEAKRLFTGKSELSILQKTMLGDALDMWELMCAFDKEPYGLVWENGEKAVIPFLPQEDWELPSVSVNINGIETTASIDTGGDILIIPETLAGEAGIKTLIQSTGIYAGGQKADYGLGVAETVRLEGLTLTSVPVEIGKSEEAIIGTSLLRHFLTTIDYHGQQLVLRPRTEDGYAGYRNETEGQAIHRIPFYLMANHILLAHGSLDNQSGLLFMIDSGLEDPNGAALTLPRQTIQYLGYSLPDTETIIGESGGGPVELDIGYITLDRVTLGNMAMAQPVVIYGPFPPRLFNESLGFIVDGILSHHFLKDYSWTIDFENMEMIFSAPGKEIDFPK